MKTETNTEIETKSIRVAAQPVIAFLLLIMGVGVAWFLVITKKPPEKVKQANLGPLVKVYKVHSQDVQVGIHGTGTVRPEKVVQIVPEVSGKVIAVHGNLFSGGYFRRGEPLIKIDPRDYELAVQRSKAELEQARVKLELEIAESDVALKEWESLHPGEEPPSGLVTREPQVNQARAMLAAAEAGLAAAKLNLERTRISMPFNGRVMNKNVNVGQFIVAGQPVGSVYNTNRVEIPVPLEDRELKWFDYQLLDRNNMEKLIKSRKKIRVIVKSRFGGIMNSWEGTLERTEAEIDPVTRMVNVVVVVDNPFETREDRYSLTPGMFVSVVIEGNKLETVFKVPRAGLRAGDIVWVMENNRLRFKQVQVARKDRDWVYITSGLNDGDKVIVSSMNIVSDGMKVRIPDILQSEQGIQPPQSPGDKSSE